MAGKLRKVAAVAATEHMAERYGVDALEKSGGEHATDDVWGAWSIDVDDPDNFSAIRGARMIMNPRSTYDIESAEHV